MRVNRWTLGLLVLILVLGLAEGAQLLGVLDVTDILANIFLFVLALVVIAVLAVIGAVFLGIFITHRIFASQAFTPFEQEMLKMREEISQIKQSVDTLVKSLEGSRKGPP